MRRIALLLPAALALALCAPPLASAQDFTGVTPLTLSASPSYPRPYQTVVITPQSTVANLSSETFAWKVNGKAAGTTTGGASFGATLGAAGAPVTVSVSGTGGAGSLSASIALNPTDVSLVPEPSTTVHPLYPGSPLVASQSAVRLVALADLRTSAGRIDPAKLVYDWRLDDQELQPQSGIGQSVLAVQAPMMYRSATITVTVSDQAGSVIGQDSYVLNPVTPIVRLYENDPLEGPLYDAALGGSYQMADAEASFIAVPYFFSAAPAISWTIGGQPSSQGPLVTVRSNGNGSGSAVLAASASGSLLEQGGAQCTVSFSSSQSSGGFLGVFGL
jgi:hypothetical protein